MDSFWIESAFYQATRVVGKTGKNPAVGCVIIKENQLVGIGATSQGGRPHAEENALKMAGYQSKGATMYISLEPCNISNNENSCTNLIIKAGIKKVVIGLLDYNKKTYKKGYKALKKTGIEVKIVKPDLYKFLLNYPHYCTHVKKRPMIALKIAASLDGKITNFNSNRKWITSKFARQHVQHIRSLYDAVLIGTNTFILDNPTLNVRIKGFYKENTRIILDKDLKIDLKSKLIKSLNKNPLIIFSGEKCNNMKYKKLNDIGVDINKMKLNNNLFSIDKIIKSLKTKDLKSILVEGGEKIFSAFVNTKKVDIIYLYRSKSLIGKKSLNMFEEIEFNNNFELYNQIKLEDDLLEVWINKALKKTMSTV